MPGQVGNHMHVQSPVKFELYQDKVVMTYFNKTVIKTV